jgi:hypothetical protein
MSWSGVFCSCIECNVQNAWVLGVVVVGGIYSPQPLNGRWGWLLSSGAPPDMHCELSGAPPRHLTVRVREQSIVGAVVFLWHRIVWCHTGYLLFTFRCASYSTALTLRALFFTVHLTQWLLQSTVARVSRCSAGASDSPVNYSGTRQRKPESGYLDFVRSWCTGHCPVRQTTAHLVSFAP